MTGAEFREARLRLGLSQAELARVMGMPQSAIARLETGERRITNIHAAFLRYIADHPPGERTMNKQQARQLMDMAEIYGSADGIEAYYWQGYKVGVRRALHGEGFNQDNHEKFLAVGDDEPDDARRLQARGYRDALAGIVPNPAEIAAQANDNGGR